MKCLRDYVVADNDVTIAGRARARRDAVRSQDFERVGAPRGGCRISGSGDDGGAEGPERGAYRREAPIEGVPSSTAILVQY